MKTTFLSALILFSATATALSQNRFDALRYTQTLPLFDPASMAMGGATAGLTADAGSFLVNPAGMALAGKSYFYFGLGNRDVSEDATYRGNVSTFNDNQTGISNIGFVFKAPTDVGSLVMGAGYAQTADFNRAYSVNAYNTDNSITDFLVNSTSDLYNGTAYDAYAIDEDEFGQYTVYEGAGGFAGADQYVEYFERGQMGEYSLFFATEFQKNLFMGVSLGLPAGQYSYQRAFLEEDINNLYTTAPYDVDAVTVEDRIDASIRGFNARIGLLYKPAEFAKVSLSYTTATRYEVNETYSTYIQTDFKSFDVDGNNSYWAETEGEITYRVVAPSRLNAGVAFETGPLTIAASADRLDYSAIEMSGFGVAGDRDERRLIRREFTPVTNLRLGASYKIGQNILRGGYAVNESPHRTNELGSEFISGGVTIDLGNEFALDLGVQYLTRTDNQALYNTGTVTESVNSKIGRFNTMIGFRVGF
jgi:hypothetical protein